MQRLSTSRCKFGTKLKSKGSGPLYTLASPNPEPNDPVTHVIEGTARVLQKHMVMMVMMVLMMLMLMMLLKLLMMMLMYRST